MSDDKTEEPTEKKLRDARQKGQVAKSQEITSAAGIILSCLAVSILWADVDADTRHAFREAARVISMPFPEAMNIMGEECVQLFMAVAVPVIAAVAIGGLLALLAQIGFLVSFEGAKPKLENLSPKSWVKKVISKKALLEMAKNLVKVACLTWIMTACVMDHVDALLKSARGGLTLFYGALGDAVQDMLLRAGAVFLLVGAADCYFQRRFHRKELMMSKDEVKREYKDSEGDPLVKSRRRQMHQELLENDSLRAAGEATVLVANPTHVAVALRYKAGETPLPLITAAESGAVALKMLEIAEQKHIPIMRNVPLARGLFAQGTVNGYIPRELMEPVAEVIRWVASLSPEGNGAQVNPADER